VAAHGQEKNAERAKNIIPALPPALYIVFFLEIEPQNALVANGGPERIFWHPLTVQIFT
jgi:hypothetical protein